MGLVNSCLKDLERRMRLKRMGRLVPQVRKRRNKRGEVSSDCGFGELHQKEVVGGPRAPCSNPEGGRGAKHVSGRGCRTRKEVVENREPTDLPAMGK